jgi:hypothetical protein
MSKRVRAAAVLLFASAIGVAAACGSFSGTNGGSAPDDAGEASTDALASSDAVSDAGVDTGPPFCANVDAAYCFDFDESLMPNNGFTGVNVTDGSTIALDMTDFTSAPRSFVSDNTGGMIKDYNNAQVSRDIGGVPTHITCELDVRQTKFSDDNGLVFAISGTGPVDGGSEDFNVYYYYPKSTSGTGSFAATLWANSAKNDEGFFVSTTFPSFDTTAWNRIRIDVTLDGDHCNGRSQVYTVTGGVAKPLGMQPFLFNLGPDAGCAPKTSARFTLGLSNKSGWRLLYDNVKCDVTP